MYATFVLQREFKLMARIVFFFVLFFSIKHQVSLQPPDVP